MEAVKDFIKRGNEMACGEGSLLKGFCNESTKGNRGKNFFLLITISIVVQYLIPVFIIVMIIPFIIGNLIASGIIGIVSMINPTFLFLYIPLGVVDLTIVVILFIVWLVIMFLYFLVNFKNIGILAIIPIVLSLSSFLIRYIPYIGTIISTVISIVPWMAIVIGVYYVIYKPSKDFDLARDTFEFLKGEKSA